MNKLHSLLRRQLKQQFGNLENVPETLNNFVDAINEAYRESDDDRAMLERSLEISSRELMAANTSALEQARRIRDLYEVSSRPGLDFEGQISEMLKLGCRLLELEVGKVCRIDVKAKRSTFLYIESPADYSLTAGTTVALEDSCSSLPWATPNTA